MAFDNLVFIGLGVAVMIYLVYKFLTNRGQGGQEYEKMYNKVLNSEEYKVKGQHEK